VTRSSTSPRVRFVMVPFVPADQPALGVSSLLAVLKSAGIAGDVRYLNLEYGERLGWKLHTYLTQLLPASFLSGDMLFSDALWGERAAPFAAFEERILQWIQLAASGSETSRQDRIAEWTRHAEVIRAAIAEAPRVVAGWADQLLEGGPRVLGFSSSFQQSAAALALAAEVRRRAPREEVAIIFGGANCEGEMGRALADNFAFIDCVVSGEAEEVIASVVQKLASGEDLPRYVPGAMVSDMDALPIPDFDDYFAAAERTSIRQKTWLVAESSRGCWWGMKSHCTFCGLNGGTMKFRSKSAARFAAELDQQEETYGKRGFSLTDNILDMQYMRTFLPDMVARARQYSLFYETKSNLRKDQVELLAAAGVSSIQPGIESFSTAILKLMGKGTTRLQNVQLLKWCAELGVKASWNLLYGFPGEDPLDYAEVAELLPSLFHLAPPMGHSRLRLDRFAPYWKSPEKYGVIDVRPTWAYDFLFAGVSEAERHRLAYFFDFDYVDGRQPLDYTRGTAERVAEWRRLWRAKETRLELRTTADGPVVVDTRPCRKDEVFPVGPAALAVIRALDGYRAIAGVRAAVREAGLELDERACEETLAELRERRFLIEDDGYGLSIVLDPRERQRVAERQVSLRVGRLGLRWPDDFPEPAKRQIVRSAMLSLAPTPPPPR
jgi:ribosomal peptide maturation radical SAM protein 1